MKYIVVTGGVVSGLGKGITISSLGRMLIASGLKVTSIKIDPYLNVDAGTMSPFEHGEVFVLGDGGEADLDLGNYERFLHINLTKDHNITTGKVYRKVISQERRGDYVSDDISIIYLLFLSCEMLVVSPLSPFFSFPLSPFPTPPSQLGKTVQVVPHVSDEIQDWIERVAKIPVDGTNTEADVCLIEVGGTVGDIESMVFLEALRQFQFRVGDENFMLMFVSLVPVLGTVGEQKTKPTQHGVKELRSLGLVPKVIFCRSSECLQESTKNKISSFCHVPSEHVLSVHDVDNIYHVPLILIEQNLHTIIANELKINLPVSPPNITEWKNFATSIDKFTKTVKIALIGKYSSFQDSYLSVIKALKHSSVAVGHDLDLLWVEASNLVEPTNDEERAKYDEDWAKLKSADGVICPGGFGIRGVEGKIIAAEYCRTNKKPILGVCLGFQVSHKRSEGEAKFSKAKEKKSETRSELVTTSVQTRIRATTNPFAPSSLGAVHGYQPRQTAVGLEKRPFNRVCRGCGAQGDHLHARN